MSLTPHMQKILILDNYDSFTYNLVHYVEEIVNGDIDVFRNDKISLNEISKYDKIILSPGPGLPENAGIMLELIKKYSPEKAILGVCLGHQAIGNAFGGKLENLSRVYHGVSTKMEIIEPDILFEGLPSTFEVGRYHSWVVATPLPDELIATAVDENGQIMALKHCQFNVRGVQFHPESVLTQLGKKIIGNWIKHS